MIDAFTDKVFHGNPAAICILEQWPSGELMLNMAVENNLSETAFAVKKGGSYHLRWFTPGGEINLCGHAAKVVFQTLSGDLAVERHGDLYEMDFPAYELKSVPVTEQMIDAIGATPREAYMGRDLLCVFDDVKIIEHLNPDLSKVHALNGLLLHVTAKGAETDCGSRT
ncbi:PhzF family phenazine biosynthesis protein, partial [Bacteroides ovatus]